MSQTTENTYADEHPEQDPAEGSRETVEHDLEEAGAKTPGESEPKEEDKSGKA